MSGNRDPADSVAITNELMAAEAALLTSQSRDYYAILGIPNDATELEIKRAYRRSSLHFHPDKEGNPEHFKLVCEAFTKLSECWS
ncbi:hypothetical protein FRB94_001965 [Tulasnella sp. JGI-2019a]|nr:hypothetical protein FRB93_010085 [Tulasnella sp. JGI-2019a]KAG9004927.1 hypothetical protein FRB94_001965 [Tulasnella sp. JGI-2019a]